MAILLLNYTGSINSQTITGNGTISSDPATGKFQAGIEFSDFPTTFNPAAVGVSLLSLSCTNGGYSAFDKANILTLTNGIYKSTRTVTFTDQVSNPLGQVVIDGTFTKQDAGIFTADVVVSGTYTGATNLLMPRGYSLPLAPNGTDKLEGNFTITVDTDTGDTINAAHNHVFEFVNGTTQALETVASDIFYDSNLSWDATNKALYVPGLSIMRPQTVNV